MNGIRALLCLVLCFYSMAPAAGQEMANAEYVPGVTLSQGITEITGVAISPLLGVSSVGAWRYWRTPSAERADLPWYAQPWAWGSGFVLLSLCFLKDSLGMAVPGLLKKPFDMAELFENKVSALVASTAFVPLIAEEMVKHSQAGRVVAIPRAAIFDPGLATLDAVWLMVPLAVVAFFMVWVCSHAINVMIILSPFSTFDAVLKLMRTGLLLGKR
jgi:phage terminase large subunit-like protein